MNAFRISLAALLAAGAGVVASPTTATAAPQPSWQVSFRGGPDANVNDIAAIGVMNAWAAGRVVTKQLDPQTGSYLSAPTLRHWNGKTWTGIKPPPGPTGVPLRVLSLVEATSPSNVWTAGVTAPSPSDPLARDRSALSRWDGKRWHLMGSGTTTVLDLDLLGSQHAWIVGRNNLNNTVFFKHFQNGKWTSLPAPSGLSEVSVRTPSDIWGRGSAGLLHWNGKQWQTVKLPDIPLPQAPLPGYGPVTLRVDAVLATPTDGIWVAAGFQQGDWSQPGVVLLHRKGTTWQRSRFPKYVVRSLSGDGGNGFWAAANQVTITATPDAPDPYHYEVVSHDTFRYTAGTLTRQTLAPRTTGFSWSSLTGVPGTIQAWAAGFNWYPPQGSVILRYTR